MSNYVVVDLEMCKVSEIMKKETPKYRNELIEIGAVLLNDNLEIIDRFKTFVKPEYGAIDSYIQKLTGITNTDTKHAPSTKDALKSFADWLPDDAILVSWSLSDEKQIRKELEFKGICIPKLEKCLDSWEDCQRTFSKKMKSSKTYKLSEALIIADIDFNERIHDALVDADNTALLFAKMKKNPEMKLVSGYKTDTDDSFVYTPMADLLKKFGFAV